MHQSNSPREHLPPQTSILREVNEASTDIVRFLLLLVWQHSIWIHEKISLHPFIRQSIKHHWWLLSVTKPFSFISFTASWEKLILQRDYFVSRPSTKQVNLWLKIQFDQTMATDLCRSVIFRNSSLLLPSNYSSVSTTELIINGISLLVFLMAFVGNAAALVVIFTPRGRTRLTNNTYLANLALADLLRTCFIPFTITARIKRNFIFGRTLCKILPIVQGRQIHLKAQI